jgi:hypothetical protein
MGHSSCAASRTVTGVVAPPWSDTRRIGASWYVGSNRITPFGPHVPPLASGASAIAVAGPPVEAIFCSFPRAK